MNRVIHPLTDCLLRLTYETASPGELLTRYARHGDVRAFEELLRRSTPQVRACCGQCLHDGGDIDEVASEVFALLAVKAGQIRDPERVNAWLTRTAENLCLNRNRKAARRRVRERPLPPPDAEQPELATGPLPDVEAELRELHRLVQAEIELLSDTLRRTMQVVQQTGTHSEAADTLGCTLDKVKQDVSRARQQVLARLRERGIVLSASLAAILFGAEQGNASVRLADVARWLARKWVWWTAITAAGLGAILLVGGAPPSAPDDPLPAATAPETETLQAKNLRIFHAEIAPRLTAALEQLGCGKVHVREARSEGSEVVCLLEGTKPFLGAAKPPRARLRYCVVARDLDAELDLTGTGDWKGTNASRIIIRPDSFGRFGSLVGPMKFSAKSLGIHQAFDLLPADERGLDELNDHLRRLQSRPADGLVLPGAALWGSDANSRYLYLVTGSGLLLARDGRGEFPGWKCIGTAERNGLHLAANDEQLFRLRGDGQLLSRSARPVVAEWRPIGPGLPGGGPLCAGPDELLCVKPDFTLWSRPIDNPTAEWRRVGTTPGGQTLAIAAGQLYCVGTRDGKPTLWSRPVEGTDDSWRAVGDYPGPPANGHPDFWRLSVWQNQLLARMYFVEAIYARPVGTDLHPWKQIGTVDAEFFRRW